MSCDVEIKLFGKVSNPEAIWELAVSAAAEGKIDWLHDFETDDFANMIDQAALEGRALSLTRPNTTDFFESVRSSCQDAGLSYVVSYGTRGAEGFTEGYSWHPGMDEEYHFLLDGKNATLAVADVWKAARQGIEAVNALVDGVTAHTRIGKIELEPGYAEAYQAFVGSEDATSATP